MAKARITRKFLLYVFLSGFAALVNFVSRFLYQAIPGIGFELAVTLAYITGMLVNFAFSKWITFQAGSSGRGKREAVKFFLVASLGLLVTVTVSAAALRILEWLQPAIHESLALQLSQKSLASMAHLCGMGAGLIANFIGHELVSFRETGVGDKIKAALGLAKREE